MKIGIINHNKKSCEGTACFRSQETNSSTKRLGEGHQAELKVRGALFLFENMTIEADWKQLLKEHHFVLATKKLATYLAAMERWGLTNFSVRDPEKSVIPQQAEPRNKDPRETAHHKISRVKQAAGFETDLQKLFLATDVMFGMGTRDRGFQVYHKIERRPNERSDAYKQRLAKVVTRRYSRQEFVARWDLGIALDTEASTKAVSDKIRIQASLSLLGKEKIEQYLLGESNAGVQMLELARDEGADFEVYLEGDPEPILLKNKNSKVLEQLIVTKLPLEGIVVDLYQALAQAELQNHLSRYTILNATRAHLLTTLQ